jgi:hypothetical protein
MENKTNPVIELVQEYKENWIKGSNVVSKYVTEDPYEDIQTIEAYLNSKHITGDEDSLGREKPFFNIVLAIKNIWARATDLDRKNIRAKAKKIKSVLASYIYNIHFKNWMDEADFGTFLNKWGDYLAAFNSAVVKAVENSKGLTIQVIDWNKIYCDVIDFESNAKVEILEFTPAQLRKNKNYDQDVVDALIEAQDTRKIPSGETKDTKAKYITVYEVHGEFPLSWITDNEDDEEYVQQMHVVGETSSKDGDFTLYRGKETKDPYMLTWLIPSVDGSISFNGSVKNCFNSQWMVNHTEKLKKDYLDIASKVILQTSDPSYANQNVLTDIETGQFFIWDSQKSPLTPVQVRSADVNALKQFGEEWQLLAQQISSVPDILQGETLPSGTAYRQAAIVQTEAHSNFSMMIENKGLHLERLAKKYITPYLLKKMDTPEEISATLEDYGIDKIDKLYVSSEATKRFNEKAVEAVINETAMPNMQNEMMNVQNEMSMLGSQRFIKPSEIPSKTWKKVIGDFEGEIVYEITPENTDKQAVLDTLSTVFQTIASNPAILQDERAKLLFAKIMEETGKISPVEIQEMSSQPIMATPQPAMVDMGQVGGAGGEPPIGV